MAIEKFSVNSSFLEILILILFFKNYFFFEKMISELPNELLGEILSHLSCNDIMEIRNVNKTFYNESKLIHNKYNIFGKKYSEVMKAINIAIKYADDKNQFHFKCFEITGLIKRIMEIINIDKLNHKLIGELMDIQKISELESKLKIEFTYAFIEGEWFLVFSNKDENNYYKIKI